MPQEWPHLCLLALAANGQAQNQEVRREWRRHLVPARHDSSEASTSQLRCPWLEQLVRAAALGRHAHGARHAGCA